MRKLILFLNAFWLFNLAFGQSIMSEKEFTELFQKSAGKDQEHITFKVFDDLYLISYFNSKDYFHKLKDYYASYTKNTENLDELLQDFVNSVKVVYSPSAEYRVDTERIVPIVRTTELLANLLKSGNEFVYDTLTKDLVILYAEDLEEGIPGYRFFTKEEFAKTGIKRIELNDLAITHLKLLLPDISETAWEHKGTRNWSYNPDYYGSKYMSGLLLLPEFLNSERDRLNCDLIISIPSVSRMGIIGVKNKSGLKEMRRMLELIFDANSQRKTTTNLYQWNGSVLEKY